MKDNKVGDIFEGIRNVETDKIIFIPHICNDVGKWGSGFVVPLAKRYPKSREYYLRWNNQTYCYEQNIPFKLGNVQYVYDSMSNVVICNMIAQRSTISASNPSPIDYESLGQCMNNVKERIFSVNDNILSNADSIIKDVEIHCPKFGSGLAGGDWNVIEKMIDRIWCENNIDVCIYSLEGK